jgi:glycosyltransferase involved in cell wall biosynthesis
MGLAIFQPIFRGVRAIMYNSHEEQALIHALSANTHVPGVVVGVGSEVAGDAEPHRARQKFGLRDPFLVYVGRVDVNKGCTELFDHFRRYLARSRRAVDLVLIGSATIPVPEHPRIRHLGYLGDADKFDLIAAADVLVMPSPYESLSMAALEAWALGRPVVANARCDVLVGQCIRSNAGLYYENGAEFDAALDRLLDDAGTAAALGRHGRAYFERHYSWPVIERKYLEMFQYLRATPPAHAMEPLPGCLARRARTIPPAAQTVRDVPS